MSKVIDLAKIYGRSTSHHLLKQKELIISTRPAKSVTIISNRNINLKPAGACLTTLRNGPAFTSLFRRGEAASSDANAAEAYIKTLSELIEAKRCIPNKSLTVTRLDFSGNRYRVGLT